MIEAYLSQKRPVGENLALDGADADAGMEAGEEEDAVDDPLHED